MYGAEWQDHFIQNEAGSTVDEHLKLSETLGGNLLVSSYVSEVYRNERNAEKHMGYVWKKSQEAKRRKRRIAAALTKKEMMNLVPTLM